jgi:KEOPS complex subunit Cgi121
MANVDIIGARAGDGPDEVLDKMRKLGLGGVLVLDADAVCGRQHMESAVEHARRSFAYGTNSCKGIAMETMLFASGERQISKAQEKMSPKPGTTRLALVLFDASAEEALGAAMLERDDSVLECTASKATAFGITREELDTAGRALAQDLVLERVAFVEIAKR